MFTHLSQVRIRAFRVDAVIFSNVLECKVHETALAAVVTIASRAVDKILFRQRHKLVRLSEMLSLKCARLRDKD